jgi:hypothetical protein
VTIQSENRPILGDGKASISIRSYDALYLRVSLASVIAFRHHEHLPKIASRCQTFQYMNKCKSDSEHVDRGFLVFPYRSFRALYIQLIEVTGILA